MTYQAIAAPFTDIMSKLRRSWKNGERLHLDREHVIAFIQSPLYGLLAELEAKEATQQWQSDQSNSGLASSGLHGAQTERNGPSAGTTRLLEPGAESQLVSAVTMGVLRQSKRKKPLPNISNTTGNRTPSTITKRKASR